MLTAVELKKITPFSVKAIEMLVNSADEWGKVNLKAEMETKFLKDSLFVLFRTITVIEQAEIVFNNGIYSLIIKFVNNAEEIILVFLYTSFKNDKYSFLGTFVLEAKQEHAEISIFLIRQYEFDVSVRPVNKIEESNTHGVAHALCFRINTPFVSFEIKQEGSSFNKVALSFSDCQY